jgi:predicted phage terminase large subunit-like protein
MQFTPDPIRFEMFCQLFCQGPRLIETPIGNFHRELIRLVNKERLAIAAPRFFAKSSYFAKFYSLYLAYEFPGIQIMVVSAASGLAEEHLLTMRRLIEQSQELEEEYGSQVTKKFKVEDLELANGSKIFAKGAGKQIRGFRMDYICVDDIETDDIVANPTRLSRMEHWFWTDLMGVGPQQIVVIGTLLHPESFLAQLIERGRHGWETRLYQAEKEDGSALWPQKWPIELLKEKRAELGSDAYLQEFMNTPCPDSMRKFRKEWIHYFDKEPDGCAYFTTVDPAIETGDLVQNDFTAIVTVAVDSDENIYVVDYINKRMLPSDTIEAIFNTFVKHNPFIIGIETVGFQKMLKLEVERQRNERKLYPVINELKSEGRKKRLRIEALQPRFEAKKIFIKSYMVELETQLLRFPSPRCKDDIIDALSHSLQIIHPAKIDGSKEDPESFIAEVKRREGGVRGLVGRHRVSWSGRRTRTVGDWQ